VDGPFIVTNVFPHGALEIQDMKDGKIFKVNGPQLNIFHENQVIPLAKSSCYLMTSTLVPSKELYPKSKLF